MGTLAPPRTRAAEKQGFVPLAPGMLRCAGTAKWDLYVWSPQADCAVLFREGNLELKESRIDDLIAKCGDSLYVRVRDYASMCDHMFSQCDAIVADESISPADRFSLMQSAMACEVERRLALQEADDYITLVGHVGKQIHKLVSENALLPSELFAIAKHDDATFAHVTNVAAYATLLAKQIGISDPAEVDEITVGAMLHDIGKRFINKNILAKQARLTSDERAIIQSHPQLGYEELVDNSDVTHAQRMMVYQHHEHVSGGGYPVRVLDDEIHPWAKLLAVVDVFDALTGCRPYRRPMSMSDASDYVLDHAGKQFDKEMAKCWVSAIKIN